MNVSSLLSSLLSWSVTVCLFLVPLLVYRRWYPRYITAVLISKKRPPLAVPVKPNKQFFRSVSLNQASSIVSIGNGYVAYYVAAPSDSDFVDLNNIDLSDHIYIFRVKKFGRFCSVDLSDRCLIDTINKFLEV